MAQENSKKSTLRWVLIALCAVIVIGGAVAAALLLNPTVENPAEPTDPTEPAPTEAPFVGLILQAPEEYTVELYSRYAATLEARLKVTPSKVETKDGISSYYFPKAVGQYRYIVSRQGFYTTMKNIFVAKDNIGEYTLDVTTGQMAGNGYEPSSVYLYADNLLNNAAPSAKNLWAGYEDMFITPAFTNTDRAEHQSTTNEEMMAYIKSLDGENDNMYVFTLGFSQKYNLELPLVIFTQTDLSSATTIEEAAALLKDSGKLTVYYQAQMHGDEPAAGEAALVLLGRMQTSYGVDLLNSIDMIAIPRLNPDGSYDYTRFGGLDEDMNRDMLTVQNLEIALHHKVLNLFDPEVAIDSHEFTTNPERNSDSFKDIQISSGYNANSGAEFIALSDAIATAPFEDLFANGMQPAYYLNITNRYTAVSGDCYRGLRGMVSLLVESRGIGSGSMMYERRVAGHMITIDAVMEYLVANKDQVQSVVAAEKQRIIDAGKTYNEDDLFVLKTEDRTADEMNHPIKSWNTGTGTYADTTQSVKVHDKVVQTRVRPTAYVIPAGQSWTAAVLEILDRHGIRYYELAAGSKVYLQQYIGTTEQATLTEETKVTFATGAYVITMDQSLGNIIPYLMEPDVADVLNFDDFATTGTLAQEGFIPAENETFPIYRYIHDLNAQGKIDLA